MRIWNVRVEARGPLEIIKITWSGCSRSGSTIYWPGLADSGSRPTALKSVRFEHIDRRGRLIHIPKPKGGEEKAFNIPLSRPMIRCIISAIRWGRIMYPEQGHSWLFPANSKQEYLVEHKEDRSVLSKWGNALRQSYRTLAQAAGVSELDIHLLMNHSLPGVNAGHITRDRLLRDHLRQQQQRISELVVLGAKRDLAIFRWLGSAKVDPGHALPTNEIPSQFSASLCDSTSAVRTTAPCLP